MDSSEDDVSLLVVILDTNPILWGEKSSHIVDDASNDNTSEHSILFGTLLQHFFVFLNAYLMVKHQNMLAVIASNIGESQFLFPQADQSNKDNISCDFPEIKKAITKQLRKISAQQYDSKFGTMSMLSGALSLALCYINRISKENRFIKPRILVLQISPDVSSQYIPVMNCIFSAQKKSVPVDACMLTNNDSTFLQQASHITGGIFIKPAHQDGLLQYLLSCFLADRFTRCYLNMPTQNRVDYRASCFCHKKVIDVGFVCSVCLSIFCELRAVCSTCDAKFALPPLPPKLPKVLSKKKKN